MKNKDIFESIDMLHDRGEELNKQAIDWLILRVRDLTKVLEKVDASWNGPSLWRGFPTSQLKIYVREVLYKNEDK